MPYFSQTLVQVWLHQGADPEELQAKNENLSLWWVPLKHLRGGVEVRDPGLR